MTDSRFSPSLYLSRSQKRSYDENSLMDKAIGINCLGGDAPTRRPEFPTVNCPVRRLSSPSSSLPRSS